MTRAALLLLALVAVAGCRSNFDPASFVGGLRLLDVKAEPPDIGPGQTSLLSALVVNPGGGAPTVTWDACLLTPPPASGQAVNIDCAALDAGADLIAFGVGPSVTATMPALDPSKRGLPDATNGFYLPVRARLDADGKTLVALYQLRIFLGALSPNPPNQNPTLMGIYQVPSADAGAADQTALDDAKPIEVHANDKVALRALVTAASSESYLVFDGDPRTTPPRHVVEKIRVSWFTTAGTFDNDVTGVDKPDTTLTLDKHLPPSGTTIDLWVVARDERGGSDWLHRTLVFR